MESERHGISIIVYVYHISNNIIKKMSHMSSINIKLLNYLKKKKKKLAYSYYFVQDCDKIKIREKSTKKEGFSVFSNTSY